MAKPIFKASMAAVYLFCLAAGLYADQVNCIKWKDIAGETVGTYCKPFQVRAGNGIQFADDGYGKITITSTGVAPGAGGADTQVNFNSSGALSGSSGLTWNNSTSTLTATHITGLDNRPYIDMIRDCGLVGDGVTDDSTAAQTCLNLYPSWAFYFPPTKTNGTCSYMFNATLKPTGEGTTIMGASSGFKNSTTSEGGTVLCWAAGITGIELDLTGQNCSGCNIKDISLFGADGTKFLVTPTLLNMPSGANLPRFTRTITFIQRATNVLTVNTSRVAGVEGLTQQVGSTVLISGVTSDVTMNGRCVIATLVAGGGTATNPTQFTCAQNGSDLGPFVEGTVKLPTTGASTADGVLLCTNFATINHVVIANFGRHGINADSSAADANCPTPFSDDLILRDSTLINNQGDGYLCYGDDCNAHLLSGNAVYYNVMWGLEDNSSLGNTHIGNQLSNGGHQWASTTTPPTKAISTISRALVSGVSTVTVVLSVADANLKLGSCIVIAGVTDSSFNTTAGQCFFITNYTNSTHFQYEQPGAPADASSSGGTSRMAKFSEAYLSSGIDDGAQKIQTQSVVAQPVLTNQYVEGGQACKFGANTMLIGGANTPGCLATRDWTGSFLTTQGIPSFGGSFGGNISLFANEKDANNQIYFKAGLSSGTVRSFNFNWWNNNLNAIGWGLTVDPTGTNGTAGQWVLGRGSAGASGFRIILRGPTNGIPGQTVIASESTGAVEFNNFNGAGTGGVKGGDGTGTPTWTVSSAGLGTFNGGLVINNVAAPTASANQISFGSTTAATVGAAGAATALPANPTGYIIVNIAGTNFKIPYYAN